MSASNIHYASIKEIHCLYNNRALTVRELVLAFLSRISEVDRGSGGLNSILEINPDVLFIADSFDEKLRNGAELTPLFGIPVLIKDNISTNDRMRTSAGSLALADNYARYDAHIVKLLRNAGAVILGKTNMTEFANYMSRENMPSGYSSRGGQVMNPFNKDITPSGSSSGSAVAVAAGLCTAAIGTETSGSIISPAGYNGIVGIKPTLGLVGRSGIIPISSAFDTAGPMTRTVTDAAVVLGVIAGGDPRDPATGAVGPELLSDYAEDIDKSGLEGIKIGVFKSGGEDNSICAIEKKAAFERLCGIISGAGALLIRDIDIAFDYKMSRIMRNEFKACMNSYLSTLDRNYRIRTLKDIIEFNQANASEALKYGQSILIDAQNNTSGNLTEREYIEELVEREAIIKKFDKVFTDNDVDIILCDSLTSIAPYTGFPSMTIPIGQRQDRIPIDSIWIARRFDEAKIIKAAYAAEKLLSMNLKPEINN